MRDVNSTVAVRRRLVERLYTEAMLLADDARAYFDVGGRPERDLLDPALRVGFSCESLKVTTRLMHVIAWLLTQRAVAAGELDRDDMRSADRRLGKAPAVDVGLLPLLPPHARALVEQSIDLHRRVEILDREEEATFACPARSLQQRLALSF